MEAALIISGALILVGLVLYIHHRFGGEEANRLTDEAGPEGNAATPAKQAEAEDDSQCCGMHITCERDSLLAAVSETIDYYDDEELDEYAGREADGYGAEEIEQFRDVMLTLRPEEIAPWARSIQLRGITLPAVVRDELLMIVAEARAQRNNA